jgi:hypothetical protein
MLARVTIATSIAVALTACGGSATLPVTAADSFYGRLSAFEPVTRATHRGRTGSWMTKASSTQNLVYVSNGGGDNVLIYTYPSGSLAGKLGNLSDPAGLCADPSGNVWIVESGSSKLVKYAHAAKRSSGSRTLSGTRDLVGCAVDAATENLAVTNLGTESVAGAIWIFPKGSTKPQEFQLAQMQSFYFCAYDNQGNLFADGLDASGNFQLVELPAGSNSLQLVSVGGTIQFPGGVQWDGQYVAVGDQAVGGTRKSAILQIAVAGSQGSIQSTTRLSGSCDVLGFGIVNAGSRRRPVANVVVAPDDCQNDAKFYLYPAGGRATMTLAGFQYPVSAVYSPAV